MPRFTLLSSLLLAACAPGLDAAPDADAIGRDRVDVCHIRGNGSINVLTVASSAVSAHLGHGDHLAGTYFLDADADGQGDPGATAECLYDDYVDNSDDCDDDDDTTYDGADEVCGDGVDNDCDGDIDEGCTVTVEVFANADNALWMWVDGDPVAFDSMTPNWMQARSATFELQSGEDHALAFYAEDWGGITYFAATVHVDGVPVASTGAGDFAETWGTATAYTSTDGVLLSDSARSAAWSNQPDDASDSLNLIFSPGTTWGDWMQPGFDDSAWTTDTNVCTQSPTWNVAYFYNNPPWLGWDEMVADGAEFVWPETHEYSNGDCYSTKNLVYTPSPYYFSVDYMAAAYRLELSL